MKLLLISAFLVFSLAANASFNDIKTLNSEEAIQISDALISINNNTDQYGYCKLSTLARPSAVVELQANYATVTAYHELNAGSGVRVVFRWRNFFGERMLSGKVSAYRNAKVNHGTILKPKFSIDKISVGEEIDCFDKKLLEREKFDSTPVI